MSKNYTAKVADSERTPESREDDMHESTPVHGVDYDKPWQPPHNLTAPTPRPGMAQRWIRVALRGDDDSANMAKSMQEGWQPRTMASVPGDFPVPTISNGKFAGCIGVQGLVLCEMPASRLKQRADYYAAQAEKQNEAVKQALFREERAGMPIEHSRKTETKTGRIPKIADDD